MQVATDEVLNSRKPIKSTTMDYKLPRATLQRYVEKQRKQKEDDDTNDVKLSNE